MNPAIEFHRVQKSFGSQPVLRDFSLSVEQGAFLTVIGRSGCGKTTALRLVNALIAPDGGRVRPRPTPPPSAGASGTPSRTWGCSPT